MNNGSDGAISAIHLLYLEILQMLVANAYSYYLTPSFSRIAIIYGIVLLHCYITEQAIVPKTKIAASFFFQSSTFNNS